MLKYFIQHSHLYFKFYNHSETHAIFSLVGGDPSAGYAQMRARLCRMVDCSDGSSMPRGDSQPQVHCARSMM